MERIFPLLLSCLPLWVLAQPSFPFHNPDLPIEERIDDVLSRMTIEEKVGQLMHSAPAIERLGIPRYNWWNESLHGVARAGYATVFPQSITMAASWNDDLMKEVATVISDEARAKHHEYLRRGQREIYQGLTFWSPNINIFRDPRWGRGHETYGEDPFLTGKMGVAFVQGLQGDDEKYLKVVATAKHYAVHSGPEPIRHTFDARVSERDLHETYLPAFRDLVVDGQVQSIMCAYNRFRGEPVCSSAELFDILRNQWGFEGYMVSDCWAIEDIWLRHKVAPDAAAASAMAVRAGCDLNCGISYAALVEAIASDQASEADLDVVLRRLFRARFQLGMFDPPERVPYAQIPFSVNTHPGHANLARQAARESIVLLKNQDDLLPLDKSTNTIAVIGPNADNVQSLWGNYNGIPVEPVTPLEGIRQKGEPQVEVLYARGSDLAEGVPAMEPIPSVFLQTPDGQQGLQAEYFANDSLGGQPLFTRIDDQVDFIWDIDTPDPRLQTGAFSVRWTGYIVPPVSGEYAFSDWAKPYMTFTVGDSVKGGGNHEHHAMLYPKKTYLEAGQKYPVEIRYRNYYGDATAQLQWAKPSGDLLAEARETASQSDVIVLALGLNERLEGEEMPLQIEGFAGGDRTSLLLPQKQRELMEAMVATGKPVVLVLINGSALAVNWANDNVPAILTAGYPGQEGGLAIADVLFGAYNPAGRLPVTYYKSVAQLPPFEDYDMEGRTYRYFRDTPLYPFGYGLSYSNFTYGNLQAPRRVPRNSAVIISVDVTNSGDRDGDEVVQLYLTDEEASTPRPIHQLVGFQRVHLRAGTTKTVTFTLKNEQLALINADEEWAVEPGWFRISVGGEQPERAGQPNAETTETIQARFEVR